MKDNIETEGIFRISPHSVLIGVLLEAYNRGQKYILWKEDGVTLPCPDYAAAQDARSIIDEVDFRDAYGVNLAASLIKVWYRELRQPIFCVSSYERLREVFGNLQEPLEMDKIIDLLSERSKINLISAESKDILVRHLLPLLSAVEKHSEVNRMTAQNLAVCFAPTLLRGPDQLQDAKMSSVIRHILEAAITMWEKGLRDALKVEHSTFIRDLQPPESPEDYEDPLEEKHRMQCSTEEQSVGKANDGNKTEDQITGIICSETDTNPCSSSLATRPANRIERKPALPPRPLSSELSNVEEINEKIPTCSDGEKVRRKPAPAVTGLPRYSAIMAGESLNLDPDITGSSGMTVDGFAPTSSSSLSSYPPPPASDFASDTASLNPWDDEKGKQG